MNEDNLLHETGGSGCLGRLLLGLRLIDEADAAANGYHGHEEAHGCFEVHEMPFRV